MWPRYSCQQVIEILTYCYIRKNASDSLNKIKKCLLVHNHTYIQRNWKQRIGHCKVSGVFQSTYHQGAVQWVYHVNLDCFSKSSAFPLFLEIKKSQFLNCLAIITIENDLASSGSKTETALLPESCIPLCPISWAWVGVVTSL